MLSVDALSKTYGKQILFEEVSFQVNRRERIGLVGRNGHGKTTLFRLITAEEQPDRGSISLSKGYRTGHVHQTLDFREDTVLKEGARGLVSKAEHHHWRVEKILAGLGFSQSDLQRHPSEFSGGFQVRLNLAKVLVSEPDLLLLDEPTNYLDITSIRWLERFLNEWPRELLLITHDRSFMDKVVTHTMGIHRARLRKIPGTTEKYYSQLAQEEEVHEKTRLKDERRRKEVEIFISRFRAKARLANLVQSRVKLLEKQERKNRLESIKTLDFSFRHCPFPAKYLLNAQDLGFSYHADSPLIAGLDLSIGKQDRICVIGRNGKGKTTLLKLLAGAVRPQKGQISSSPNMIQGFFEQTNIASLVDSRTVEEEILYSSEHVDSQLARSISGAMMFEGDHALKKIGVLSGGEKSRVMLGKILATPVNLLLLDEPTNHLDMESCDALLAALDNFKGAVVIVTHNEMFLHALAERLVVFQNDRSFVYEGSYQSFLDRGGWSDESAAGPLPGRPESAEPPEARLSRKELRRRRAEIIGERGRVLAPLAKEVDRVESAILVREQRLKECTSAMQEATQNGDGSRIAALSRTMHDCREEIDRLFEDLEAASEAHDRQKILYEQRLAELEAEAL